MELLPRAGFLSNSPVRVAQPETCTLALDVGRDFSRPSRGLRNAACDHFKQAALLFRQPSIHSASAANMSMPPVITIPMKRPCTQSIAISFDRLFTWRAQSGATVPTLAWRSSELRCAPAFG